MLTDALPQLAQVCVRDAFRPRPGTLLLASDYKQLEMRLLAALSRDEELGKQLASHDGNSDFFARLAARFYGKGVDAVSAADRDCTKQLCYGIIYGLGHERLASNLQISWERARRLRAEFLGCFRELEAYLARAKRDAKRDGGVATLGGRRRPLPGLSATNDAERAKAERQVVNSIVQGSAADVAKEAMLACWAELGRRGLPCRLVCQIHDELLFEVMNGPLS